MCMMDKYYLTEDEAIMLGCLRMQVIFTSIHENLHLSSCLFYIKAESGDFNPKIHNLDVIKERVTSRFPNPVREKLKTLTSANATDLCSRVQGAYARLAGKLKAESQINYLECLRTWCPFYGSTFFDVQCQYDENPLDASSSPPVLPMSAAIGPLALFLIVSNNSSTKSSTSTASISSSTTMIRHPYHRIVKWVCHADKHIFTYWIIKATTSLDAVDEAQRQYQAEQEKEGNFDAGGFDVRPFCDCVYLVCPQVRELEYLVKSYVHILRPGLNRLTSAPSLPGASGELLPVPLSPSVLLEDGEEGEEINSSISGSGDAYFPSSGGDNDREKETEKVTRRRSMLGALLGIGTASPETQEAPSKSTLKSSGSGLELNNNGSSSSDSGPPLQSAAPPIEDATKTKSLFRSIYGSGNSNSSSSGNRKTAKKKKSVNFSDKVDVSATPPPVPTAGGEEEADSDIEPPDEEEDEGGDDSDEGGAEAEGAQNMTVKFAAGISDVQDSPLRDWSEVDDLDSDDDGPPVSNAVYKKKSNLPDGSVGAPPPPPPPPQRRSSVDAIRRASTAIFGTFRAKASDKSDPTSGGAVSDPEETKQQSSEEQKKKSHSEASEL